MDIQIMDEKDLTACAILFMDVFNQAPWNEDWTLGKAVERLTDLFFTPKFFGIVCYYDYKLIGFAAGNRKVSSQEEMYYLAEFCVRKKNQGTGNGTILLKALEEELITRKINNLYLLTAAKSEAEVFYQRNGYTVNNKRVILKKNL
ncbi:GNAT family N-acetyltransferase [Alteribacillus sp. JSM 102045]|uniref:GNAT family N-acetyltransferase n=1 Tax=Alteribacillus sp. JSM 102045 TaxID=1562101 RepID=UPI0035BFCD84